MATLNGGLTDFNNVNDTIHRTVSAGGFSGVYTIGSAPSDYLSITDALSYLNIAGGVCGPVYFDIKPGNYNERLSLSEIDGMSAVNTITFRAQNGDSTSVNWNYLNTSIFNYVIRLNYAKYFRFERLTISSTSNSYITAIAIEDSVQSIIFTGCRFITQGSNGNLIDISDLKSNDLLFDNNYFEYGGKSINILGNINNRHSNIAIKNNVFFNSRITMFEVLASVSSNNKFIKTYMSQ